MPPSTATLFAVLCLAQAARSFQTAPVPRARRSSTAAFSTPNADAAAAAASVNEAAGATSEPQLRIGHGYDIHRLEAGAAPLVVGGVTIPFELGVVAHSDGDVIYHSICDAIFGALGLPDIGQFFPDNDPRWKGATSDVFMAEAHRQMDLRGYKLGNVDVTLIAQKPRMMPHKPAMKENIVALLQSTPDRVNVKARTHEGVDAVGEVRAIECHVCLLMEKAPDPEKKMTIGF